MRAAYRSGERSLAQLMRQSRWLDAVDVGGWARPMWATRLGAADVGGWRSGRAAGASG